MNTFRHSLTDLIEIQAEYHEFPFHHRHRGELSFSVWHCVSTSADNAWWSMCSAAGRLETQSSHDPIINRKNEIFHQKLSIVTPPTSNYFRIAKKRRSHFYFLPSTHVIWYRHWNELKKTFPAGVSLIRKFGIEWKTFSLGKSFMQQRICRRRTEIRYTEMRELFYTNTIYEFTLHKIQWIEILFSRQ